MMRTRSLPAQRRQTGFTLIELVMVIVILAVLAAVAIPKFVDLGTDAKAAALSSVAGSLTTASAINYAARKVNVANGAAVTNCTDVNNLLQTPLTTTGTNGYVFTAAAIAANVTASCTLTQTSSGNTTTFSATGIL
jgi:prepilin-type N-terminal cleavage/methylation domain-containing protein